MQEYDIAIIGGGPAGIMAAIASSKNANVILLEKNSSLGLKLLLTGGGRCNITNNKPIKKLLNSYSNKNFLKHSFYSLTNEKLLAFFEDKGLKFIEEDNNRIFPKSQKAGDILKILLQYLGNVVINYNFEVKSITNNFIINSEIKAKKIIIATGGDTNPKNCCNPSNNYLTSQPITKIKYGLVPLITEKDLSNIAGTTLFDVVISYNKVKVRGDVLISHVGLSGPGIIDISNKFSKSIAYNLLENKPLEFSKEIAIDLCPNFSHEDLSSKFLIDFQNKGKTLLKNYLKLFLTNSFIEFFLNESSLDGDVQLSKINKRSKNKLIDSLKHFKFEIVGFNENLSKITIGGIDLNYINPKTMESKIHKNLYFAGEILDLDGPTGGYNLKIAFSTGYLAGLSASKK